MNLLSIEVSRYGLSIQTYFGDLFIYPLTLWAIALLVGGLLLRKVMRRKRARR